MGTLPGANKTTADKVATDGGGLVQENKMKMSYVIRYGVFIYAKHAKKGMRYLLSDQVPAK